MATAIKVTEDASAEQPTLEWLVDDLGWDYAYGPDIAPGTAAAEREHWDDMILRGRLRTAIEHLNPGLPADAVRRVIELVQTTSSPVTILDHRDFHDFLLRGVPI